MARRAAWLSALSCCGGAEDCRPGWLEIDGASDDIAAESDFQDHKKRNKNKTKNPAKPRLPLAAGFITNLLTPGYLVALPLLSISGCKCVPRRGIPRNNCEFGEGWTSGRARHVPAGLQSNPISAPHQVAHPCDMRWPHQRVKKCFRLPLDIVFLKLTPLLRQSYRGNECGFLSWAVTDILGGRQGCTFPSAA